MEINTNPTRYFSLGAAKLVCEHQDLSFDKAYELFVKSNPKARHTVLFESDGQINDKGEIVYNVPLLAAKTNG